MFKKLLILLCIITVCMGLYYYWQHKPVLQQQPHKRTEEALPLVSVGKIEAMPFVLTEEYIGYVSAIKSVEVHPFISGFIDKVYVKGGEYVKKGDPLFLLQQGEYLADMEMKKAGIAQALAAFENASTYYERTKRAGENTISESDVDKAKSEFVQSAANLVSAIAAYKSAKVMYDYTFINAPIDGIVGNITITEGQYVSPNASSLAYLIQPTPIRVVFSVSNEKYLNSIVQNPQTPFSDKRIRLKLANGKMYEQIGEVEFLDNQVNTQTSSVQVWANFENPDNLLLKNAYVDVVIEENIESAVLIPQKLVSLQSDGMFVWVVEKDGKLQRKKITTAQNTIDNGFYLVLGGLSKGDFIVLNDAVSLKENQNVQIKIEPLAQPRNYSITSEVK